MKHTIIIATMRHLADVHASGGYRSTQVEVGDKFVKVGGSKKYYHVRRILPNGKLSQAVFQIDVTRARPEPASRIREGDDR